jgi:hypothetical protein
MKILDIIRRIWSEFETIAYALDYALDYDQHADIRARVARMERLIAYREDQNK